MILEYFSSSIDWCEPNMIYSKVIVEYFNSYSSLFISLFGIYGMYYHQKTILLNFTLIPIGITSFYFHATLSKFGQLLDELSIMITFITTIHYINNNIYKFCNCKYITILNIFQLIMMFINPNLNRFIFFTYALIFIKLINRFKLSGENLGISKGLFFVSFLCWLIDYVCYAHLYLHCVWHILIGLTGFYFFKTLEQHQTSL